MNSLKITFPGADGDQLAARLETPDSPPRAYALFAHCFTCGKDNAAAVRIARALAEAGVATLRFDFTGLGQSDGDFANTNFSSNVADLAAAAAHLRAAYAAPKLLVGHSLGGAAVLAAAHHIPEVRAVATIGAPSDVAHVVHQFAAKAEEIESAGAAEVVLGGRTFTVKRQMIDDLRAQPQQERIARLRRPLLVMHAPLDAVVGIDNATAIFSAARHPKSFISLDDADHFLSTPAHAAYAAGMIVAWSARYLAD
ncbi:MAG: alpha/beta hydrolase [Hyphomonadaceae bacterium]|nr:alpha/beta hydrolase [Hyphomonadaceae bacterium]